MKNESQTKYTLQGSESIILVCNRTGVAVSLQLCCARSGPASHRAVVHLTSPHLLWYTISTAKTQCVCVCVCVRVCVCVCVCLSLAHCCMHCLQICSDALPFPGRTHNQTLTLARTHECMHAHIHTHMQARTNTHTHTTLTLSECSFSPEASDELQGGSQS